MSLYTVFSFEVKVQFCVRIFGKKNKISVTNLLMKSKFGFPFHTQPPLISGSRFPQRVKVQNSPFINLAGRINSNLRALLLLLLWRENV